MNNFSHSMDRSINIPNEKILFIGSNIFFGFVLKNLELINTLKSWSFLTKNIWEYFQKHVAF